MNDTKTKKFAQISNFLSIFFRENALNDTNRIMRTKRLRFPPIKKDTEASSGEEKYSHNGIVKVASANRITLFSFKKAKMHVEI